MTHPLEAAARRLRDARAAERAATDELAEEVRRERAATGAGDQALAARAGVARMTVRKWLGLTR